MSDNLARATNQSAEVSSDSPTPRIHLFSEAEEYRGLRDRAGTEVPPEIAEAFAAVPEVEEILTALDALTRRVTRLPRQVRAPSVKTNLNRTWEILFGRIPLLVCPECQGKGEGCERCSQVGYLVHQNVHRTDVSVYIGKGDDADEAETIYRCLKHLQAGWPEGQREHLGAAIRRQLERLEAEARQQRENHAQP